MTGFLPGIWPLKIKDMLALWRLIVHFRIYQVSKNPVWLWLEGTPWDPLVQPLPQQGHLQHIVQDDVQTDFEYLHRVRLHNISRQLLQRLPASEWNRAYFGFISNFVCFILCPLPLVLSVGTKQSNCLPYSLTPGTHEILCRSSVSSLARTCILIYMSTKIIVWLI